MKRQCVFCCLLFLALCAFAAGLARASTLYVRPDGTGDYPNIQAALDAAGDGDDVVLAGGTFAGEGNRDLLFHGKAIILRSEAGDPDICILDCQGWDHRGFRLDAGETRETRIEGIKVKNGMEHETMPGGGAVFCNQTSPTIRNCVFENCTSESGNYVSAWGGSPLFQDCRFRESSM